MMSKRLLAWTVYYLLAGPAWLWYAIDTKLLGWRFHRLVIWRWRLTDRLNALLGYKLPFPFEG
jgi:hypothetical protein